MKDEHFNMLLRGEPITETVQTARGSATIQYMSDAEELAIIQRKAELLGNREGKALSELDQLTLICMARLDVLVIAGPEGWIVGQSERYPDWEVKIELYGHCLRLCQEIRGIPQPEQHDIAHTGKAQQQPAQDTADTVSNNIEQAAPRKISGQYSGNPT